MIKNFIAFIQRRKAEQLHAVIDAYVAAAKQAMPIVLDGYGAVYKDIINKTYENPDVAINLLTALDAAVKLYGPGVRSCIEKVQEAATVVDTSSLERAVAQVTEE